MRHRSRVKSILLGASATRIQRLRQSGHTLPNLLGALLTHLLPCDRRAVRAVQRRLAILCASNPVWPKNRNGRKIGGVTRAEARACGLSHQGQETGSRPTPEITRCIPRAGCSCDGRSVRTGSGRAPSNSFYNLLASQVLPTESCHCCSHIQRRGGDRPIESLDVKAPLAGETW